MEHTRLSPQTWLVNKTTNCHNHTRWVLLSRALLNKGMSFLVVISIASCDILTGFFAVAHHLFWNPAGITFIHDVGIRSRSYLPCIAETIKAIAGYKLIRLRLDTKCLYRRLCGITRRHQSSPTTMDQLACASCSTHKHWDDVFALGGHSDRDRGKEENKWPNNAHLQFRERENNLILCSVGHL